MPAAAILPRGKVPLVYMQNSGIGNEEGPEVSFQNRLLPRGALVAGKPGRVEFVCP